MADISVTPKQEGNRSWIWMVVAIVAIAALMIWLANQEGTTAMVPVVEEDSAAVVAEDTVPADTAAGAAADTTAAAEDTAQ